MTTTCNRCQGKWEAEVINRNKFYGNSAARVLDFSTCPHCGQTDNHWVYASDIMPEFAVEVPETINPDYRQKFIENKVKKACQNWLEAN